MISKKTIRLTLLGGLLLLALAILALAGLNGSLASSVVDEVAAAGLSTDPVPTLRPAVERKPEASEEGRANLAPVAVLTRTRSISTGSFLFDQDETDIVMSTDFALVWAAVSNDEAGFYVRRPADWNGTTPIKVTIYFALGGNGAGSVNWRLKLNTYTPNSGEWLTNPGARDADAILNFASGPSWYRIYSQSFTLQPADFHDEPLWSFFFVRGNGTNGETFRRESLRAAGRTGLPGGLAI